MALPKVTKATDALAKEMYKRTAGTAVRMGICVSCKQPSKLKDFVIGHAHDQFAEYKTDGLCFRCNNELNAPFVAAA